MKKINKAVKARLIITLCIIVLLWAVFLLSEDSVMRFVSGFFSTMLTAMYIAFAIDVFQLKKDPILRWTKLKIGGKNEN